MAHVDDLSAALQAKLKMPVVKPILTQIIFDPDDKNVDLSNHIRHDSAITITKSKIINPAGALGKFQLSELTIDFMPKDLFNQNLKGETFYYATTRLYDDVLSTATGLPIPKGAAAKFSATMKITIDDEINSTNLTIQSIDTTTYSSYDVLNFAAAIGTAYSGGTLIEVEYLPGRPITIKNKFDGLADTIFQFKGILKGYPKLTNTNASITLFDIYKQVLDISLKANDTRTLISSDGDYLTNLEYDRAGSSAGTFSPTGIDIVQTKCKIGDWNIRFTSATAFIFTDPDGIEYSGDTGDVSFDAGGQFSIDLYHGFGFSGTFEEDDEINFKTTCSLGKPVNSYVTIPDMLHRLLTADFGAALSTSDLDVDSFTDMISEFDGFSAALSFTSSINVLKAIEVLQQHINATVFFDSEGKYVLGIYRPKKIASTLKTLSPDADIQEVEQDDYGNIKRILAHYNYNHETSAYDSTIVIPEGAEKAGAQLEINLPAFHASDTVQAKACAEHIYIRWRRGVKNYRIKEKINTGIAFDINDIYQISSDHPEFPDRLVEISKTSKTVNRAEMNLEAEDLNFSFGDFAFCDIDYADSGKVVW